MMNTQYLQENGITHIVNAAFGLEKVFPSFGVSIHYLVDEHAYTGQCLYRRG